VEEHFYGVAAVIAVAALGLHNGSAQDQPIPEKQIILVRRSPKELLL
jgi:hypothetical protein